jgi:hypothetical protein
MIKTYGVTHIALAVKDAQHGSSLIEKSLRLPTKVDPKPTK